ncbi:hypothetical protein SAMN03159423_5218 [Bradyrhizobium sp. NFR13]|jgi:hypothetical protein|uniref:DUF4886 domain-containing protein n=1 Tax=Bradyrhizobium sp. NFR13 TaxID=1566285 RepID=UPI0008F0BEDC|nr:DUF4886 domain-containing protein [Bradyrhizobium sp. NFR13]SFM06910.1 hypothetical protein SAMN03159423_5218 [Bradyrhizobium sp. NFR13]
MSRTLRVLLVAVATLAATASAPGAAQAQTKPKVTSLGPDFPKTEIFIGNSFFYFNNSMHSHVLAMVRAADPANRTSYQATSVTIGGSGFEWHDVESYFRPNAIASYSFDDNNNIIFNKRERLFDAAIMMDCSQCPIHPKLKSVFTEYAKKDADIVRAHGAKPVFFMSWAYEDKPEMTQQLAEAYTVAGNDNNALVIPAGLAFARMRAKQPELNLYQPDRRHPSMAGTYLASCVVFTALTGRSPVGNPYLAGLDEATAKMLQTAAWETVQDYYGK